MCGIRLVIADFRTDATKTLKNGQPGATRIDYGDAHDPSEPIKWLWRYVDGARTANELYGRALTVIAAEQYACQLVVPQSQRGHTNHWSSHKDRAAKALAKLAKPHLPGSLAQLQKAIDQAHRDTAAAPSESPATGTGEAGETEPADEQDPTALDALEDDDLDD